jgi:hypothetical protein
VHWLNGSRHVSAGRQQEASALSALAPATFASLLQEAVNKPGIISAAYRQFHNYSLGKPTSHESNVVNDASMSWSSSISRTQLASIPRNSSRILNDKPEKRRLREQEHVASCGFDH